MVAAVRRGASQREVACRFGAALSTVQFWVRRAQGKRLDRVDWDDRSRRPMRTQRTNPASERKVLVVRKRLKERSALGEYGAQAIFRQMQAENVDPCPSVRTIGRILQRHGVLDAKRRQRRCPPLRGWYLPDLAAGNAELDSFDTIEGLAIRGGPHLTVLTGISLHGGLAAAWPQGSISAKSVVEKLVEHWQEVGVPAYAQFDNDQRFSGPRQHPDTVGRVSRLCLSLGVVPVFAPPNETGFQAAIESFNGRWQAKVWNRFEHKTLRFLQNRSGKYVAAARQRNAARIESAPPRRPFPKRWRLDLQKHPQGTITFIRRTNDKGRVNLLGHTFAIDRNWLHRLVRAEVDLSAGTIRIHALRRRVPTEQPLLNQLPYELPKRKFKE